MPTSPSVNTPMVGGGGVDEVDDGNVRILVAVSVNKWWPHYNVPRIYFNGGAHTAQRYFIIFPVAHISVIGFKTLIIVLK